MRVRSQNLKTRANKNLKFLRIHKSRRTSNKTHDSVGRIVLKIPDAITIEPASDHDFIFNPSNDGSEGSPFKSKAAVKHRKQKKKFGMKNQKALARINQISRDIRSTSRNKSRLSEPCKSSNKEIKNMLLDSTMMSSKDGSVHNKDLSKHSWT